MKHIFLLSALLAMLFLAGCSIEVDKERLLAMSDVKTPFAAGGVLVNLRAEPDLNSVNDMPNSCTVLIIQMQDPAALEQLLNNPVALRAQFSSGVPAENVLKTDRYVMMPGQSTTLHIDRAYGTRQVAFIAGYYPSPGKQHVLSIPVPVETWNAGWIFSNWQSGLGTLKLSVVLGKAGIVSADYPRQDPTASSEPADSKSQ